MMNKQDGFHSMTNDFLKDFKKWVNSEHDESAIVKNSYVRPKSDHKTIFENIDCPHQENTTKDILKCFFKNGGRVKKIFENTCPVVTKKGKFYINKEHLE